MQIGMKTHEQFIKEYLSQEIFFYNATDSTKIELERKTYKSPKKQT